MIIVCVALILLCAIISYLSYIERNKMLNLIVSRNPQEFFMMQDKKPQKELEAVGLSDLEEAMIEREREQER